MMWEQEWEQSLQALREGDYTAWPRHECIRTGTPGQTGPTPTYDHPIWDGSEKPITLLVNADFGMGDTIHFYRFIPEAQKRVKRLILRCDEDFRTLFTGTEVISPDVPLPEFDEIIHMMALPRVLQIRREDIKGSPYLTPNYDEQFSTSMYLFQLMKFTKIGICWRGNPFGPREVGRSIPVELFKPWMEGGMQFFSLDKIDPAPEGFFDCREFMSNWNQTANLLTYLDLVVSVDTAVAHLAGAMGVQVATLVNATPDWRWGTERERDKTVWYDSMHILRQKDEGDWVELLARLWKLILAS